MLPAHPPSLRERKKTATRERIYLEALGLFSRKGFSSTTVEEIAEAAEVSKGTFFNYFPGKESLLHELGERLALEAGAELNTLLPDPQLRTRQQLSHRLHRLAETVEAGHQRTRMALLEFLKAPDALAAGPYRRLLQQSITALLADGQRRGEVVSTLDPELMGSTLAGAYLQQLCEWCASRQPYPLAQHLDQIISVFWTGVGAG
jgi:AcrR family transcriptional regulator